jgi:hypothetical protein
VEFGRRIATVFLGGLLLIEVFALPKDPSPTWRSFLHNPLTDIAAIDMFVVPTATFRLLYAVIVLGHDRRRVIHFNVTQYPTGHASNIDQPKAFDDAVVSFINGLVA